MFKESFNITNVAQLRYTATHMSRSAPATMPHANCDYNNYIDNAESLFGINVN